MADVDLSANGDDDFEQNTTGDTDYLGDVDDNTTTEICENDKFGPDDYQNSDFNAKTIDINENIDAGNARDDVIESSLHRTNFDLEDKVYDEDIHKHDGEHTHGKKIDEGNDETSGAHLKSPTEAQKYGEESLNDSLDDVHDPKEGVSKNAHDEFNTESKHSHNEVNTELKHSHIEVNTESKHSHRPNKVNTESKHSHDEVDIESRHSHDEVNTESKHSHDEVDIESKHSHDEVNTESKHSHDEVNTESKHSHDEAVTELLTVTKKQTISADLSEQAVNGDENKESDKSGGPGKKGQLSLKLTEKMEKEIFQPPAVPDKGLVTPPSGDKRRQKADEWLNKVKSPEAVSSPSQSLRPADTKPKKDGPRNISSWKQREEEAKKKKVPTATLR